MQTLVSVNDLLLNLESSDWALFDCRFSLANSEAGLKSYHLDHIPNARYADLNNDLSAPVVTGKTGRHPLPDMDRWIEKVRSWGVEPTTQVVAYDASGGPFAARLWWLFRWSGHERVAVLDGGLGAWMNRKYPVSPDLPDPATESNYELRPSLTRMIEAPDLLQALEDKSKGIRLLDAREAARFRGEEEPLDAVAGHIPGALCVPFGENLDRNGFFLKVEQLKERFDGHLTNADGPSGNDQNVVCYCGSGVTAAHNILAMVHAGLPEPILYGGSWSEWILDPQRPIETR
ncbi:MAG: sulfurtransferase [Pseudomonadales bacterium]|jgi:thiosulfate/3-mercaptopyruvate sulfurtransferase|nr:sulfurtransferase [Pseudomonadales bacterium]MDP7595447.1 sulfurtransferase [Pseudomonadales bacterium]HJN49680.1 sulfurtransferase [Pseudomonadales bacterium]|tara:strand:- start:2127 stop:2993 length:867 start_codon:yes stop_codon:yes gene_type:complete